MIELPVKSCEGCGACCRHLTLPLFVPGPGGDMERFECEHPELAAELRAEVERRDREDDWTDEGPCFWYDAATGRCKHHDARPDVCRAYRVRSPSCVEARELYGIKPNWPYPFEEDVNTAVGRLAANERTRLIQEIAFTLFSDLATDHVLPTLEPTIDDLTEVVRVVRRTLWAGRFENSA